MNAAEVLANPKAYTALRSLQSLDRLAAQANANAMSYRGGCAYDGTIINNANAEAQADYREAEFVSACEIQARAWGMDPMEVRALAQGEHKIQHTH